MKTILTLSAFFCLIAPSFAQTVEQDGRADEYSVATERAQDTFLKYQMAMEAEVKCNHAAFSAEDLAAMNKVIAEEMVSVSPQVSMGAARLLNLRRKAADDMDERISSNGCDSKRVKESMQFFDERLANAHGVNAPPPYAASAATAMPADEGNAPILMPISDDGVPPAAPAAAPVPTDIITNDPARMPAAPTDDMSIGPAPTLTPTAPAGEPVPLTPVYQ